MPRFVLSACLAIGCLSPYSMTPSAHAEDRKPETILKEIDAVELPKLDRSKIQDRSYVKEYLASQNRAVSKRASLIGELYKADPENTRMAELLPVRWMSILQVDSANSKTVITEADEALTRAKSPKLRTEAAFYKAQARFAPDEVDVDAAMKDVEAFIKAAPGDERGPGLLYSAAMETEDAKAQTRLLDRVIKDYPKSGVVRQAQTSLKKLSMVGKPFHLEFTDAITGSEVSMKSLKGKVVVVDFWATWCGPCVAEMPKMKKLYAEFKDRGVEFIGVSLDQPKDKGGLDKLKEFVAKNEIAWPQYYQGEGWKSEFSSSQGINSIPAVFVVDADGTLYSVNGRGHLETMVPELLRKGRTKAGASGGGN